jgi:hypothetical protein
MLRTLKVCSLAAILLALTLPAAAFPGLKHKAPNSSRTVEDLRLARALLQRSNEPNSLPNSLNDAQDEVSLTMANIDKALAEIDQEGVSAQKNPRTTQRIDPRMLWREHLAESLRLVEQAQLDCVKEKAIAGNADLHARVMAQLDEARTRIAVAIQTVNFDYSARNLPTRND